MFTERDNRRERYDKAVEPDDDALVGRGEGILVETQDEVPVELQVFLALALDLFIVFIVWIGIPA